MKILIFNRLFPDEKKNTLAKRADDWPPRQRVSKTHLSATTAQSKGKTVDQNLGSIHEQSIFTGQGTGRVIRCATCLHSAILIKTQETMATSNGLATHQLLTDERIAHGFSDPVIDGVMTLTPISYTQRRACVAPTLRQHSVSLFLSFIASSLVELYSRSLLSLALFFCLQSTSRVDHKTSSIRQASIFFTQGTG